MHYGFWVSGVHRLKDALTAQNKILATLSSIRSGQQVLDAGCGVGGTAVYLAKHYGSHVQGVSLSNYQVGHCEEYARREGVKSFCRFIHGDYHYLPFEDNTYDVVLFIESLCHSQNKEIALHEAIRVLRKGGYLVISDGFQAPELNIEKMDLLRSWTKNWAIPNLLQEQTIASVLSGLAEDVRYFDYTSFVLPSSRHMYRMALGATWIHRLKKTIGAEYGNESTRKVTKGALAQFKALKKKAWRYGVLVARK